VSRVRILGIDPGSRFTGWGVIDQEGSQIRHVASGRFQAHKLGELPNRLVYIFDQLMETVAEYQPDESALEQVFVSVNGQTTLILGQARGAAMLGLAKGGVPPAEYSATQVKSAVVGQGRATKSQVTSMVQVILGLQGQKLSEDQADALAVAICHANSRHFTQNSQLMAQQ